MNPETLAPIYLDNKAIALKDPKPMVSAVLAASGREGVTQVRWLQAQSSTQGTLLRPDHTLDRTSEPTKPIYLTSVSTMAVKAPTPTAPTPPWQGKGVAAPAVLAPETFPLIDEEIHVRPFAGNRPKPQGRADPAHGKGEATGKGDAPAKANAPGSDMDAPRTGTDVADDADAAEAKDEKDDE